MTATDSGLEAAVQRVMAYDSCRPVTDGYCETHGCTWDLDAGWCPESAAVARAAREDVADLVREARAAELERAAELMKEAATHRDVKVVQSGTSAFRAGSTWMRELAAAIREGRTDGE